MQYATARPAVSAAALGGRREPVVRLRWSGLEGEFGLAEESGNEPGLALDAGEAAADSVVHAGGGEVAQAGLHAGPAALDRVEVGGVGGQPHDGQPVRVRAGELSHGLAAVGFRLSQISPERVDNEGWEGMAQVAGVPR